MPHESSLFLPGKVVDRPAKFLVDSGCTTNLLSRKFFDTLSAPVRRRLRPYEGNHGTLADGSHISFYGVIEIAGSVRNRAIQETFIVGQLKEDAILGMPFLQRHRCSIDFKRSVVLMGGTELACVDKSGHPLTGEEPVVRGCTTQSHTRATVHREVDGGLTSRPEVVQNTYMSVPHGHGCEQPTKEGKTSMQCDNFPLERASLPANTTTGHFPSVTEDGNGPSWETTTAGTQQRPSLRPRTAPHSVPPSSRTLGENQEGCADRRERQGMAVLLHKPEVLPHSGNSNNGLSSAVQTEVPLPLKDPPWGGAPCGDAEEARFAVPRMEAPPVRRDRPRVSKPPWTTAGRCQRCSGQPSVYQTDLPNTVLGVVKCPRCRTEGMANSSESCDHHGNINFALAESHTRFIRRK